jgi:cephalosporin hydroxylase
MNSIGPNADNPPAPVVVAPETTIAEYWLLRAAQHTQDSYLGIGMSKFPEDLRAYEHLIWAQAPRVVIELGAHLGASALWFRDRLRTLASYGRVVEPRVISVDVEVASARANIERIDPDYADSIVLVQGDVCDPAVREEVGRHIPAGASCLVIEDSAHTEETTRCALELYADLVPAGGFFVVEDGCVDVEWMRLDEGWPRGVLAALRSWLGTESGSAFRVRHELELYGVSCHPSGFLQRKH